MPKYRVVKTSKLPQAHQLPIMAENLSRRFNKSCSVAMEVWCHSGNAFSEKPTFRLSLIPGFKKDECSHRTFTTWRSFQDYYFNMIKEK